ncbi:hypothetical protein G9A89_014035 [Geosiphon pyriformis]|nr:hypothetical protein G9A89_014035 [Geosiphon pyriformis]
MELAGISTGGSGSGLTSIVDLLAGLLFTALLYSDDNNHKVSWRSEVENDESSISKVSDIENLKNIIAEKTSYINSNTSETDNMMDNTTPRKMASTFSKFFELIRSSFTFEMSLKKAKELVISKKILVNNDVKQVNKHLDRVIVVKKIPVDLSKSAVESVFSKFGKITLVEFELSKTADLVAAKCLLASYDRKTYSIDHNLATYVCDQCAVILFSDEASKLAVIGSLPVFKDVNLCWASLFLDQVCLANIYKKKQAPIAYPVSFGSLFWAKIVGEFSFPSLSNQNVLANISSSSEMKPSLSVVNGINDKFTTLERSFASLAKQVDKLAKKLDVLGPIVFYIKASVIQDLINSNAISNHVHFAFSGIKKLYHASKLAESLMAKEANIRAAIQKRMESFEMNKDYTIRSVLEHPFHKVVLDHLVVDDKLILEPNSIKSKTVPDVSSNWCHQYQPLEYVFDEVFSGVMYSIDFDEFFGVVSNLPDSKAAGLLNILNKLWKHYDKSVLDMLLVLLNCCLSFESVPSPWKEAWILMILKLYEWKGVLTNTCPITLIEMACKILSKILSNKISLVCSTFDVLHGDNFLVLKRTMTQFLIFAIELVIKNALEKNQELWLVLQNMQKAYNSVGWDYLEKSFVRIKICDRFIQFFENIYRDHTNRVMMDFGLRDSYHVHDSLDQGERVFYDPLLCEIKCQKSVCEYKINSHFISRSGFGSSQNATQHILDIVSEFFWINNISINNEKTVTIPINNRINDLSLFISGLLITIAKKGNSHQYLGIFLSTEGFLKSSLAKIHSDVQFFINLVLRKAVLDKQFLYLVLAVLYPIVSYKTQFSFVPDALIHKGLKLKSGLPLNFPGNTIYHSFFYGLKFFLQIQSKSKIALFVSFVNSGGILGHLFSHQFHNLQVWCWRPVHPLVFPVCTCISASNNFLADMICIFYDCNLFLNGFMASFFWFYNKIPMSAVLDKLKFIKFSFLCGDIVLSLWINFMIVMQWKILDLHSPVLEWFKLSAVFFNDVTFSSAHSLALNNTSSLNILKSSEFVTVCDHLLQVDTGVLFVYTDEFLKNLGTINYKASTAAFFEDIGLGLGVGMSDLMSSTLVELQTIALALKCVLLSNPICLFSDNQSALDAYKSELGLVCPDFYNQCWIEPQHIFNVKNYFDISENEHTNIITGTIFFLGWCLPPCLDEHFIVADSNIVSCNSKHFVGSGSKFLENGLVSELSANACTYFMKALHYHLPDAIQKCFYSRLYSSVLCLYCDDVKMLDYVFSYRVDKSACCWLLYFHMDSWRALSGSTYASLYVLQLLLSCTFSSSVFMALFKDFVFDNWFHKTVSIFYDSKLAGLEIVKFVYSLSMAFRNNIWLVYAKYCIYIEKNDLIPPNGSALILVSGLSLKFSADVVKLLGMADAFGICFGFRKSCSFFSNLDGSVSVYIAV